MGSVVWRVGKRSFFMLYDYGKGLAAQFWVGIERQGPLEMDPRFQIPPYMGHKGWMASRSRRQDLTIAMSRAARVRRSRVIGISLRGAPSRRSTRNTRVA